LNTADDEGTPRLSPNEHTIYFWSDRNGGTSHIYWATRQSTNDPFNPPAPLGAVNSSSDDASPTVTADGNTMALESARLGGGRQQLFLSTRTGGVFSTPAPMANINGTSNQATPYLLPNGSALYFSSDRAGGSTGQDIYRAALQADGTFDAVTPVAPAASSGEDYSPTTNADETILFWGSTRTVPVTYGDYDVFYATRKSASDTWGPATNAGDVINSGALDIPGWISPDGCALYFESTRPGGAGKRDLYVTRRPL
jgi:Tol biopolymer transport system component